MTRSAEPGRQPTPNRGEKSASNDADLQALGSRVRARREAVGLTQEALAHAAGLHWTYVGQIERGERNLTYRNVLKLARGLEVEPAALMPGSE